MKVTIGGDPGSGKSTTAKRVADELDLDHYSTGEMFRRIAHDMKLSLKELSERAEKDDKIDERVDKWQRKLGEKEDDFVLDARLGFHFIPDSIKIALRVDSDEAAKRLLKDERREERYESFNHALNLIEERERKERERYLEKYNVDIRDNSNYDLIIDTTDLTKKEVLEEVVNFIKENKKEKE